VRSLLLWRFAPLEARPDDTAIGLPDNRWLCRRVICRHQQLSSRH
jgi:hypothetical protein